MKLMMTHLILCVVTTLWLQYCQITKLTMNTMLIFIIIDFRFEFIFICHDCDSDIALMLGGENLLYVAPQLGIFVVRSKLLLIFYFTIFNWNVRAQRQLLMLLAIAAIE